MQTLGLNQAVNTLTTRFNVHGSVHCDNILVYKSQQDAHVTEFIFV
jgi:hypothetical protein